MPILSSHLIRLSCLLWLALQAGIALAASDNGLQAATSTRIAGALMRNCGQTSTLPDLIISENRVGAIQGNGLNQVAIAADASRIWGFDASKATVRVETADGKEITPAMSPIPLAVDDATTWTSYVTFKPAITSSAATGPLRYRISGLVLEKGLDGWGDSITLTVGGAQSDTPDLDVTPGTVNPVANEISGSTGAYVTREQIEVSVVDDANTNFRACIALFTPHRGFSDPARFSLRGLNLNPASADQGKSGAIYVAAIYQNKVYFFDETGGLTAYQAEQKPPAYFKGSLAPTRIKLLLRPMDLSVFTGTQFVVGYGASQPGQADPFEQMLQSSNYFVVATVKSGR